MGLGLLDHLSQDEIASLERQTAEREERDRQDFLHDARTAGLAEGEAKGKAEGKVEVAVQMLQEGCTHSLISKVTGLSKTKISRLKNGK